MSHEKSGNIVVQYSLIRTCTVQRIFLSVVQPAPISVRESATPRMNANTKEGSCLGHAQWGEHIVIKMHDSQYGFLCEYDFLIDVTYAGISSFSSSSVTTHEAKDLAIWERKYPEVMTCETCLIGTTTITGSRITILDSALAACSTCSPRLWLSKTALT